jgi:hypothetical protein
MSSMPRRLERLELVPAGRGVEHPDGVMLAILVIGETGIAAGRVEADLRLAVMRDQPGFLDRLGFRRALGGPVIGIAAERDD